MRSVTWSWENCSRSIHDFIDPELGRANPYGVYDIGADEGWVSVGNTKTRSGLKVRSETDTHSYPKGLVVSDADFSTINIEPS